jgi:CMP-N,N'-diacetyllegionaminic acid synthase
VGLRFEDDLDAWRRWQDRRHPLRMVRGRVTRRLRDTVPVEVDVRRGSPEADLLVAVEATHASVRAAVVDVLPHLDPARVTVVSPPGAALPVELGPAVTRRLDDLAQEARRSRAVLAAGHYTAIGAAAHAVAADLGVPFVVAQHGLLTPVAPPLPAGAHLLAWSEADAAYWTGRRHDVLSTVVGSQLLWSASRLPEAEREAASIGTTPVYLGQLHAAELSRTRLARAALAFCRTHGAVYRPHPSERDRVSRLLHEAWRRRGVTVDPGSVPLAQLTAPVVSVFSTGVLEAAARVLGPLRHAPVRRGRRTDTRPSPPGHRAGPRRGTGAGGAGVTRTLCVIPARGGSKGIPRKNLADCAGKPLIAWTVEQALAVDGLDVVVSTEDAEIAEVAAAYGAAVVHRPLELAEDTTPTEPVVEHVIAVRTEAGRRPDRVLLLQATSPVRRPGTLDRALAEHTQSGADALVGVVPQAPFLWWASDPPRADYDVGARPRRQDLSSEQLRYRETGSLYVTRAEVYLDQHNRLGGRIHLFVMDEAEGTDIDTMADLAEADRILREISS